jgi:hypothetical protein
MSAQYGLEISGTTKPIVGFFLPVVGADELAAGDAEDPA